MPLRRAALLAAAFVFLGVGVWFVREKKGKAARRPSPVAPKSVSAVRPRSAVGIMTPPQESPNGRGLTIKQLLDGPPPKLSRAEVESFLGNQGRTTVNLLAASRLLSDLSYVREAAKDDPLDPAAQLELALRGETPEERSAALAAFRAAAPGNSLADYVAARHAFVSGEPAAALSALAQSLDDPLYVDYTRKILAGSERAFRDAGYDPVAATAAAMFSLPLVEVQTVQDVARRLDQLQQELIRSADFDVAEPGVLAGLALGRRMQDQAPRLMDELVGISVEKRFLQQLDPLTAAGPGGQAAGERIEALDARQREMTALGKAFYPMFASADEASQARYLAKMKAEGEYAAMRWFVETK